MIVAICFLFGGCKSNPNGEVVNNKKNANTALQKVLQDDTPVQNDLSSVPDSYTVNLEMSDGGKIIVDASVVLPDTDEFPVTQLRPITFTEEKIDLMAKTLVGADIYAPREDTDLSKTEIMDKLLKLKSGEGSDLYQIDRDAYLAEAQPEIEHYEQLYLNAPSEPIHRSGSTKLEKVIVDGIETQGMAIESKEGLKTFGFQQYEIMPGFIGTLWRYDLKGYNPDGLITENVDIGLKMTVQDAKKIAKDTLASIGLDSEFGFESAGSMPSGIEDYQIGAWEKIHSYDDLEKCYVLVYTRQINGVSETYVDRNLVDSQNFQQEQYNYIWPPEYIKIAVSDAGILLMEYYGPYAQAEVIKSNVPILSFDEITSVFEKQIILTDASQYGEDVVKLDIQIDKVVLGSTRVINANEKGTYLLIPTWDFIGTVTIHYPPDAGWTDDKYVENRFGYSFLTINAIDGTVINKAQGY